MILRTKIPIPREKASLSAIIFRTPLRLSLTRAREKLKTSAICHTKTINGMSLNYLWRVTVWQMVSAFLIVDIKMARFC